MKQKFQYALEGINECYLTQSSFRLMCWISYFVVVLMIILEVIFNQPFTLQEIMILVSCIAIPLGGEIINTALEKTCDLFSRGWILNEVKIIKDVAAGGVLILSISSFIIGLIIFIPKIVEAINV
jgi:diacylglycerol kinase